MSGIADAARRWRARAEVAADNYQEKAKTQPLLALPLTFVARYAARQGPLLASAIAFRLFLWLMPLALLGAGVLALVSNSDGENIETASKSAGITGAASQQVVTALQDAHKSWWIAVLTGAVLLLWTTRTLMRSLTILNAHLWGAPVPKPRQKDVLLRAAAVAGCCIALISFTAFVSRLYGAFVGAITIAVIIQSIANGGVWFFVLRRLPDRRHSWIDLLPGCAMFGIGLALMNVVSRVYLPRRFDHSSELYGSLGIAAVILAWLLLIGQLVVCSSLANAVWSDYRAGEPPEAYAGRPAELPGSTFL